MRARERERERERHTHTHAHKKERERDRERERERDRERERLQAENPKSSSLISRVHEALTIFVELADRVHCKVDSLVPELLGIRV